MKKLPLALLISTAFAAPAALADVALGNNLAVYGAFKSAVEMVDASAAVSTTAAPKPTDPDKTQTRLADQRSVLGFKYKADIDADLTGLAYLETRIYLGSPSSTAATLGDRNTFVGLSSKSMGTVRMGRYDNAYKLAIKQASSGYAGNLNEASKDYDSTSTIFGRLGARQSDILAYESPTMAGFTALATWNYGRDSTPATGATALGTDSGTMPQAAYSLGYAAGPFSAAVAYTKVSNQSWNLGLSGTTAGSSQTATVASAGDGNVTGISYGAQYKFGAFTLGGIFESVESKFAHNTSTSGWDLKQNAFVAFAGMQMGNWDTQIRHARAEAVTGTGPTTTTLTATGAEQTSVVAAYDFGKKVRFVGSYTILNNETNAAYKTGSAFNVANDVDLKTLALGLEVSF